MNKLLTQHFTEEEFIELRDGKSLVNFPYLDGQNFIKNRIVRNIGEKRNIGHSNQSPKTKEYPGGPLIEIKVDPKPFEIQDSITLLHTMHNQEHLWFIDYKINKSGWCGTDGISEFRNVDGWTVLNHLGEVETYIGIGDTFGELKPFSQSIENSKLVGKVEVGDTFVHVRNGNLLYVVKNDGITTMLCEKWGFNRGQQSWNDVIPTPKGPIIYHGDRRMTEDDILNMYYFLQKSKIGSENLEDYFGYNYK